MFVHWGLYSLLGADAWKMFEDRSTPEEYAQLAGRFHAEAFDARAWARAAASAGQRWITFTSRHHEGFSMYDTRLSDFAVTRTPFGRDPIAELATACAEEQIGLGVYISIIDWSHPGFRAALHEGSEAGWSDFIAFLHGQAEELCTQYGPLAQVWFDGLWPRSRWCWDHPDWFAQPDRFDFAPLYELVHRLQPDAILLNNRKDLPLLPGEDVQGFEGHAPGTDTSGFNVTEVANAPIETCLTMNGNWGWTAAGADAYPTGEELHSIVQQAFDLNSNVLLNVGPRADGALDAGATRALSELGRLRSVPSAR